ncbi:acyl-CoA dehydrogenase [Lutibacter sp.]|uniref:acyl-CoA dehydrogenase n=1 Tax=Lutibacter sp. TaxID=1925666 RepID=UPI0025BA22E3|nr:acyl-CoA dehydrogenase [Lutibacter sp.]MCF6169334.1 acyl-CoA dehydrogenase [Lutibacter sp.]
MENNYVSIDTLKFLLYNVHQTEDLLSRDRFSDYDKTAIDIFLDSIKTFSDTALFPYIKDMDEKPSYFENGSIKVHPQFENIIKLGGEMGIVGLGFDYNDGGLQLPSAIFHAAYFIMEAANNHVSGYFGLTAGAANLILSFGSQKLKDIYVPNMLDLTWGGTMCLTESQAGSSLSDIKTTATPTNEDYHLINGQKIFISAGDHQFSNNFVHLVLARIKGAPSGIKGVSLFVVPKKRPDKNGELIYNSADIVGEFEKMGQKGYCTTHIVFGDNNDCRGWLVGEPNKGLSYMFQMMNEARIATGRMGTAIASAAYYASLKYANERPQGRKLNSSGQKNIEEEQTLIINHPDVKRMLFTQKAIVEGSMSLIFQTSNYSDKEITSTSQEDKEKYNLLLELLTPIAKTYPAEKGIESTSNAVQILGGYGFCFDFMPQQYYRDIRIISLYEGTTGIQSLDLLGRKITVKNGKALKLLAEEIQQTINSANNYTNLKPYATMLLENVGLVQKVISILMPHALKGNYERFLADATVFMDFLGTIVVGWQWLKTASTAQEILEKNVGNQSNAFYESKIHTMKFFYTYELIKTKGLAKTLMNNEELTISVSKEVF